MWIQERGLPWQIDPLPGQVGVLPSTNRYSKGALPLGWAPNGSYVGTPEQWLLGSEIEDEPPLLWGFNGQSVDCAAQLRRKVLAGAGRRQTIDGYNDPLS